MTPEGKVKERVRQLLKRLGCWYFMPVPTGRGVAGVPDFIICYNGRFIAIETKAPGKESTTTPAQRVQLAGIKQAGGVALVVSHVDEQLVAHITGTEDREHGSGTGQRVLE